MRFPSKEYYPLLPTDCSFHRCEHAGLARLHERETLEPELIVFDHLCTDTVGAAAWLNDVNLGAEFVLEFGDVTESTQPGIIGIAWYRKGGLRIRQRRRSDKIDLLLTKVRLSNWLHGRLPIAQEGIQLAVSQTSQNDLLGCSGQFDVITQGLHGQLSHCRSRHGV
ncbi:hypothetical protein D3C79_542610 [compost metagenome]